MEFQWELDLENNPEGAEGSSEHSFGYDYGKLRAGRRRRKGAQLPISEFLISLSFLQLYSESVKNALDLLLKRNQTRTGINWRRPNDPIKTEFGIGRKRSCRLGIEGKVKTSQGINNYFKWVKSSWIGRNAVLGNWDDAKLESESNKIIKTGGRLRREELIRFHITVFQEPLHSQFIATSLPFKTKDRNSEIDQIFFNEM